MLTDDEIAILITLADDVLWRDEVDDKPLDYNSRTDIQLVRQKLQDILSK